MAITRLNNNSASSITSLSGLTSLPSGIISSTPAFRAKYTNQQASINTYYKLQYDIEDFDTDNCYDTTNRRFTPNVSGKYYVCASVNHDMGGNNFQYSYMQILKNGSTVVCEMYKNKNNGYNNEETCFIHTVVSMNGTTDYLEVQAQGTTANSGNFWFRSRNDSAQFYGFRIIE